MSDAAKKLNPNFNPWHMVSQRCDYILFGMSLVLVIGLTTALAIYYTYSLNNQPNMDKIIKNICMGNC